MGNGGESEKTDYDSAALTSSATPPFRQSKSKTSIRRSHAEGDRARCQRREENARGARSEIGHPESLSKRVNSG